MFRFVYSLVAYRTMFDWDHPSDLFLPLFTGCPAGALKRLPVGHNTPAVKANSSLPDIL